MRCNCKAFPEGVNNLPLGRIVIPFLFIEVYRFPAGAESTISSFFVDWQEEMAMQNNTIRIKNCLRFIFLILKKLA